MNDGRAWTVAPIQGTYGPNYKEKQNQTVGESDAIGGWGFLKCCESTCPIYCGGEGQWGCGLRWWFVTMLLVVPTILFLFTGYAVSYADAITCDVVFQTDSNSIVTRGMMREWTKDINWPLPHPTYNSVLKACVCGTDQLSAGWNSLAGVRVPVFVTPTSVRQATLSFNKTALFPTNFPTNNNDYIKVCLPYKTVTNSTICTELDLSIPSVKEKYPMGLDSVPFYNCFEAPPSPPPRSPPSRPPPPTSP